MVKHSLALWLASLACTLGCVSERTVAATQVLVVVTSDSALAPRLTSLRIDVQRADGSASVSALTLPTSGRLVLPLSIGVVRPRDGADTFRVVVTGFERDTRVVEQSAKGRFESARTLRLELVLGTACAGVFCAARDQACYPLARNGISAGACGPIADEGLQEVEPSAELVGVGTIFYDAGTTPDEVADAGMSLPELDAGDDAAEAEAGPGEIDYCADDPCGLGGDCESKSGQAVCTCKPGFVSAQPVGCKLGPQSISAGDAHACALHTDGTVSCWGHYGDQGTKLVPKAVPFVTHAVALAAGRFHDCALLTNGSVACWGDNTQGQLGAGAPAIYDGLAVAPRGLGTVAHLYAASFHNCVLEPAGTVQCWGEQLASGTGATESVWAPTRVEGVDNVKAMALAVGHTCVVRNDGSVYCWGKNTLGQIGNGTTVDAPRPVQVPGISGATEVAAGNGTSCALTATGLWCWGENSYQDEITGPEIIGFKSLTPTLLPTPAGAHGIALGGAHLCVLDANERLWCRGSNHYGQLGIGSFASTNEFVKTLQLESFDALALGHDFNCVRLRDGTAACWGQNTLFQLGLGYNTDMWLPTALSDL